MGSWSPLLTSLSLAPVALLSDFKEITITPKLGDAAECVITLDPFASGAGAIQVASHAVKLYDDEGTLRFFGKVWEPYERGPQGISIVARDPLAELAWRRVRLQTTYTAEDAGDIAIDRVNVQNGHRTTYLRAQTANRDISVDRTRVYGTGKREDEILLELSEAIDGFWYRALPTDDVNDVMADLHILYPDAGTTHEDVRFEYGPNTLGTLSDYTLSEYLPRNRFTVASGDAAGGRLSAIAENTSSIATYGLLEDESTYSDVTDVNLLQQQADASLSVDPPQIVALTPTVGSPLVLFDFDVGDFVRLRIEYGTDDIYEWVRVLEASLTIDRNGSRTLTNLVVERLPGGRHSETPETLFRRTLDEQRRRLEALERRVENQDVAVVAPPAAPGPSDPGGGPGPPPSPTPPPPTPPPPPPNPTPTVGLQTQGLNYMDGTTLRRGVEAGAFYDTKGLGGTLTFTCSGSTITGGVSGSGLLTVFFDKGPGNHSTAVSLTTPGGSASAGPVSVPVPPITAS